ncbi:MAG TPA: hypothetical protein VMU33_19245 [Burkholderiaceae bacterium]|nr:hypothetical protein [Burkholderiaceae bacterium]
MKRTIPMAAALLLSMAAMGSHATAAAATAAAAPVADMNCTLILPPNPLSAQGLATPFQLTNTDAGEECHELNPDQSAFVQAAIIDPQSGQISVYAPLVVDKGTKPAVAPIVPTLPPGSIVALWFGFNGNNLKLQGSGFQGGNGGPTNAPYPQYGPGRNGQAAQSHPHLPNNDTSFNAASDFELRASNCVNGFGGTLFSQVSYCNAVAFFQAANQAIRAGKLTVPPLGTGADGQPCPSVRSFTVVDQDQSDNVPVNYLSFNGQVAQYNAANLAALPGAVKFGNPGDNRLVDLLLDPALGCTPMTAPDLSNPGVNAPAQPLNELQARMYQAEPRALMPLNDPMTEVNGTFSLPKTEAYARGVDQFNDLSTQTANATAYCTNLRALHPAKLQLDKPYFVKANSPFPTMADSLFTFMAMRYVAAYELLNCQQLINQPVNVTLTTNAAGVVVGAAFTN